MKNRIISFLMEISKRTAIIIIFFIVEMLPLIVGFIGLKIFQKNIFNNCDFWFGYMAYFGTVLLGAISFVQNLNAQDANKRLTEENNNLQKIMAQSLMPTVRIENLETFPIKAASISKTRFPDEETFSIVRIVEDALPEVIVNVDVKNQPLYEKQVLFRIKNISDSFIRHIAIDHIQVCGIKDHFSSIICNNNIKGNGFGGLYCPNEAFDVEMLFYTNDKVKAELWDNYLGGISFILYLTNTSMYDIKFQEYIEIKVLNNGYQRISYGHKSLEEEELRNE